MRRLFSFFSTVLLWLSPAPGNAWEIYWHFCNVGIMQRDSNTADSFANAYGELLPSLYPFFGHPFDDLGYPQRWNVGIPQADCQIRNIGKWKTNIALHVFWPSKHHQSIVLRDADGLWHFVWVEVDEIEFKDTLKPEIWQVNGQEILAVRRRIDGSGGFWDETYWILEPESGEPRLLDLSAIEEAQNRIMPPDGDTRCRSGTLDLRNLSYSRYVWSPRSRGWSDPEGIITMSLAIEGTRVVVADARWNPSKEE